MDYKYVYTMKTEDGTDIKLTMSDLTFIHGAYRFLATREYINDNYPNLSDEQLDAISEHAIELEDNYHYREDDAIEQAFDEVM